MPIRNINTTSNLSNLGVSSSKLKENAYSKKKNTDDNILNRPKTDDLFISNQAKQMKKLKNVTDEIIAKIDKSESLRLEEIKLNLKSGFYNNDSVIDQVADNILTDEFNL